MKRLDGCPVVAGVCRIIAAGVLVAAAAVSCGHSDVVTDKVRTDICEPLADGLKDSVRVNVEVEYPVSGLADSVKNRMVETIVEAAFGSDYAGMEINAAASRWTEDYVTEYRTVNRELLENFSGEDAEGGIFNWENQLCGYFSGRYGNTISYTVYNYIYSGGAHGSASETSVNMDRTTGKLVNEADFFIPGYRDALSAVLSSHLRDALPDQESYDALFVKDIEPNGNFKVAEDGITYVYGQYEIGPYYLGIIKVTVPWDELGDLVRRHPEN